MFTFDNIGKKIKELVKTLFIIEVIIYIIVGIILIAINKNLVSAALLIMLVGPIIAWISSWLLYGFGQLIDNTDIIVKNLCTTGRNTTSSETSQSENQPPENPTTMLGKCEFCDKENVPLWDAKIVDDMGIRYRRICSDCYKANNASPAK